MKVVITNGARLRLRSIIAFHKKHVSERVAGDIRASIMQGLADLLSIGKGSPREYLLDHKGMDHRRHIIGNYKIVFRINGDDILVTDIFDARRDPNTMRGE